MAATFPWERSTSAPAFWTDGVTEFNLWPPKAQSRYLSDANTLRHSAREHVLETSGCKQFTALAASLAVLATDPDSSETVTISAKSGQHGVFVFRWTDTGREEREVKGIACESRTFTAEVWESPAVLNLNITTQTPESRNSFLIPYRYFLATGGGSVELHQGGPPVTLNASHFDAERGPNGEKRNVATGFSPVTIPYTLTPAPGSTTLSLSLPPGSGNVTFALDVEETIQSGRVYSTGRSCELVTRELRLPAEYFAYRKECEKRANKLLVDLNRRFAISAAPGPRFDPRRETVVDYLVRLSRTAPELVREALANLPRQER